MQKNMKTTIEPMKTKFKTETTYRCQCRLYLSDGAYKFDHCHSGLKSSESVKAYVQETKERLIRFAHYDHLEPVSFEYVVTEDTTTRKLYAHKSEDIK